MVGLANLANQVRSQNILRWYSRAAQPSEVSLEDVSPNSLHMIVSSHELVCVSSKAIPVILVTSVQIHIRAGL